MASAIPIMAPPGTVAAAAAGDDNNTLSTPAAANAWTSKAPGPVSKSSAALNASAKPVSLTNSNKTRTCRNIVIHGFCKYEGKGCEFNHDVNKPAASIPSPELSKAKLHVNSPIFKPSNLSSGSVKADSINAPEFVPKSSQDATSLAGVAYTESRQMAHPYASTMQSSLMSSMNNLSGSFSQFGMNDMSMSGPMQGNYYGEGSVNNYYYQGSGAMLHQPLQYHLYNTPLPHVSNLLPHQKTIHGFFISDSLREELHRKNEMILQAVNAQEYGLPEELHEYHSLYPLDLTQEKSTEVFGYQSSVYKSMCSVDGRTYALRRIEGFRLTNELAMQTIEGWRRIRHANIVSIREAFTSKAFGDHSLIFVYDYHPCSKTLYDVHFGPQAQLASQVVVGAAKNTDHIIHERILWSYLIQLTSALKKIHSAGVAARLIDPTKILVTGKNRVRLNCCGIMDMLTYDSAPNIAHLQQDDILNLGQLMMTLACKSLTATHSISKSIDYIAQHYSQDMKNMILFLMSQPVPMKTVDQIITMLGPRVLQEINDVQNANDVLESDLGRELENGRLARLLMKFGFINERPEFDMDPAWSETGDRYIIKLFRDYVFHQVDEAGLPVLDVAHVLTCLNKLDAGVDEKIVLMSRDELSCLIVSYREIKACIESAFRDLSKSK
ncbi:PAB-dependent poly(A)-specific ribonuclease subunit 3 [Dissophora globulifera]|uniref:PAN2-PAN3 deadenylation complex subunit PAN3 n=1 Tax=Dissophora globulifera TaxID=979702 RepID=A0A9P6RNY2_9FUNG|nr:PAB-dependent poly(A)-specific ribonuclease subunit 3 [Dissophora globulifera]